MSSQSVSSVEPDRFSNLREPKLPGVFRLPPLAALFLVIAALAVMVISQFNLWAALAVALLSIAVVTPTAFPRKDGYGRYEMMFRRRAYSSARKNGRVELLQGLAGEVPGGECRLPGVAASTGLSSHVDAQGRGYGLVHWPHAHLYAVVLQCDPAGFEGLDQGTKNDEVGHWAGWLASLNTVPEIAGVSVVIETAPDSGQRLLRSMDRGRVAADQLPEFAAAVEQQVRAEYRTGSPVTRCWVTISLTAKVDDELDGQGMLRGRDEMADQIGDLLPVWTSSLAATGAGGSVFPCTMQQITDQTRVEYDPSIAVDVEEANLSGEGTGIMWEQAGPVYAKSDPTVYWHEGSVSRTWQMLTPPRGFFYAETLHALLAPHPDVPRKRVAILYRPETPAASAEAAENDVKAARFRASQGAHAKAVAEVELESALQTSRQEAQGAPLVRAGLVITATCGDQTAMRRATRAVVTSLAAKARMTLRGSTGTQDVGFLLSMPLGLVPQTILTGPAPEPKSKKKKEW